METLFRDMCLLRRLDRLFFEMARQGATPFSWSGEGWEAAIAGALAALQPTDWISPDLQAWPAAVLRGASLEERLRALPEIPGHAAGRVLPVPSLAGLRVQQALGSAWAARREGGLVACFLGPTELARPETLDALRRAQTLELPVLFLVLGEFEGDFELDAAEAGTIVEQVRELAGRVRQDTLPAAICFSVGEDPLRAFEEKGALPARRCRELRAEVRDRVSRSARSALGEARAAWILRSLDERDMEERNS